MGRISINTEASYDLARKLKGSHDYFIEILRSVYQPYKNLDLEVRSKPKLEELIYKAIRFTLAKDIYKLGVYVEKATTKFIETDNNLAKDTTVKAFDRYFKDSNIYTLKNFNPGQVPKNDTDNDYIRGKGSIKSNCTWYAIEAVNKYSNDTIDIKLFHEMGARNAKTWGHAAFNAMSDPKYNDLKIESVDQIPEPGSIYCDPNACQSYGHVAFVDTVIKNDNGSYRIRVSEENYFGKSIDKAADEVFSDDKDVRRWTRWIDIPAPTYTTNFDPLEKNYSFIHFDIDNSQQKLQPSIDISKEAESSAKLK